VHGTPYGITFLSFCAVFDIPLAHTTRIGTT
jgi:hypothetical protein